MSNNRKESITLRDKTFDLAIHHDELRGAIDRLAARINEDYRNREIPLFVGVLNGAFMFMAELMQRIDLVCEISFVKLSSYQGTASTGTINELIGLQDDIQGRHVIVVDDIVDTGQSVEHLIELLSPHRPASLEVAAMFIKPDAYKKEYNIKYAAMEIPDDFIVGFGLDYDRLGRNLKHIYKIADE